MHWLALIVSGSLEAFFPMLMLWSESYTHLVYTPVLFFTITISIFLMKYSMTVIPLAIAYMVWTALGILGTSLVGILVLNEPVTVIRSISLLMIIVAIMGLKVSSILPSVCKT